jgi:ubiquinone biosynthesis protein
MDEELNVAASVFSSLPRPTEAHADFPVLDLSRPQPQPSLLRTLVRCARWTLALSGLNARLLIDRLRGQAGSRNRGRRLREMLEWMGGAAVKVGQQMSVRIDLLPFEVCDELAKLQDSAPPFPTEYAIARIEETTGRRMAAIFNAFDPQPIGSASIACVYQANLLTGQKVAVKVRRPDIVERIGTDLRVIDWLTKFPEALALVKPDFFKYFRDELRQMLMEELDFEREARYQRLFRREAKNARLKWLSAPKVFSEFCSSEVIVSEFVEGVWCRELLTIQESGDADAVNAVSSMGISPRKVAQRLLYTQFWSSYEALFFHADPHPSNILIQRGSRLLFVDFGSCGSTSARVRRNQQALLDHLIENNVSGMVEAALHLIEPIPPIDVNALHQRIETIYNRQVFALRDKQAEWWERTTMGLWMAMVNATQEFKLPINLDVIRQFRSSLLYDTLAFRLNPDLKLPRLYRRYRKESARRAAKAALRRLSKGSFRNRADEAIVNIGDAQKSAGETVRRVENATDELPIELNSVVNKGAQAVAAVLHSLLGAVGLLALGALFLVVRRILLRESAYVPLSTILNTEIRNPELVALAAFLAFRTVRKLLFRLRDRDSQAGRRQLPGGQWT